MGCSHRRRSAGGPARARRCALRALARARTGGAPWAREAGEVLAPHLRSFRSWDDWSFSRLTGDGFPLELGFGSGDGGLRFTVEVAGARVAASRRVRRALDWFDPVDANALKTWLARWPAGGGAGGTSVWLGGRAGRDRGRYKLYLRPPDHEPGWSGPTLDILEEALPPATLRSLPGRDLRLVAFEPGSGTSEVYFGVSGMETWKVESEVGMAGWPARVPPLFELLERITGRSLGERLPGWRSGISYAVSREGRLEALTVFFFARSLFGGDRRTREALLRLREERGWPLAGYAEASRPLERRDSWCTYHGLVGFRVSGRSGTSVQVGLRPPPGTSTAPERGSARPEGELPWVPRTA